MQGVASGAFNIDELNTELFFVTLNKSDKDFSPTTQYNDYFISENRFHWQSQNTMSHSNAGERYVNQNKNGRRFILFVRKTKKMVLAIPALIIAWDWLITFLLMAIFR